ncbi:hypothetical protein IE53DRAFT_367725 [Violaceomyces palustris]|uniref:Uncharacterized protein n=1 Tax=Violaceomyces palustris TaxID=1673888 RepID=A0ACD0P1G1_9BASI|nr:hypothetical protein IE53DRAFT_367725 [Violaceomyces palustris]
MNVHILTFFVLLAVSLAARAAPIERNRVWKTSTKRGFDLGKSKGRGKEPQGRSGKLARRANPPAKREGDDLVGALKESMTDLSSKPHPFHLQGVGDDRNPYSASLAQVGKHPFDRLLESKKDGVLYDMLNTKEKVLAQDALSELLQGIFPEEKKRIVRAFRILNDEENVIDPPVNKLTKMNTNLGLCVMGLSYLPLIGSLYNAITGILTPDVPDLPDDSDTKTSEGSKPQKTEGANDHHALLKRSDPDDHPPEKPPTIRRGIWKRGNVAAIAVGGLLAMTFTPGFTSLMSGSFGKPKTPKDGDPMADQGYAISVAQADAQAAAASASASNAPPAPASPYLPLPPLPLTLPQQLSTVPSGGFASPPTPPGLLPSPPTPFGAYSNFGSPAMPAFSAQYPPATSDWPARLKRRGEEGEGFQKPERRDLEKRGWRSFLMSKSSATLFMGTAGISGTLAAFMPWLINAKIRKGELNELQYKKSNGSTNQQFIDLDKGKLRVMAYTQPAPDEIRNYNPFTGGTGGPPPSTKPGKRKRSLETHRVGHVSLQFGKRGLPLWAKGTGFLGAMGMALVGLQMMTASASEPENKAVKSGSDVTMGNLTHPVALGVQATHPYASGYSSPPSPAPYPPLNGVSLPGATQTYAPLPPMELGSAGNLQPLPPPLAAYQVPQQIPPPNPSFLPGMIPSPPTMKKRDLVPKRTLFSRDDEMHPRSLKGEARCVRKRGILKYFNIGGLSFILASIGANFMMKHKTEHEEVPTATPNQTIGGPVGKGWLGPAPSQPAQLPPLPAVGYAPPAAPLDGQGLSLSQPSVGTYPSLPGYLPVDPGLASPPVAFAPTIPGYPPPSQVLVTVRKRSPGECRNVRKLEEGGESAVIRGRGGEEVEPGLSRRQVKTKSRLGRRHFSSLLRQEVGQISRLASELANAERDLVRGVSHLRPTPLPPTSTIRGGPVTLSPNYLQSTTALDGARMNGYSGFLRSPSHLSPPPPPPPGAGFTPRLEPTMDLKVTPPSLPPPPLPPAALPTRPPPNLTVESNLPRGSQASTEQQFDGKMSQEAEKPITGSRILSRITLGTSLGFGTIFTVNSAYSPGTLRKRDSSIPTRIPPSTGPTDPSRSKEEGKQASNQPKSSGSAGQRSR